MGWFKKYITKKIEVLFEKYFKKPGDFDHSHLGEIGIGSGVPGDIELPDNYYK